MGLAALAVRTNLGGQVIAVVERGRRRAGLPDLGLALYPALGVIGIFGGHNPKRIGFRQQIMLITT